MKRRVVEVWGERKTLDEWESDARCSVPKKAVYQRLVLGWPPERAIGAPLTDRAAYVDAWEERKTLRGWLKDHRNQCPSLAALRKRLEQGWRPERAITTPAQQVQTKDICKPKLSTTPYMGGDTKPKRRSECPPLVGGERRCPWASCRYHKFLWVSRRGKLTHTYNSEWVSDPGDLANPCALDDAQRGAMTLEEVGGELALTRERVRQIEEKALARLRERAPWFAEHLGAAR